jgi:hypothetical protein
MVQIRPYITPLYNPYHNSGCTVLPSVQTTAATKLERTLGKTLVPMATNTEKWHARAARWLLRKPPHIIGSLLAGVTTASLSLPFVLPKIVTTPDPLEAIIYGALELTGLVSSIALGAQLGSNYDQVTTARISSLNPRQEHYIPESKPLLEKQPYQFRHFTKETPIENYLVEGCDPDDVGLEDYRTKETQQLLTKIQEATYGPHTHFVNVFGPTGGGKTTIINTVYQDLLDCGWRSVLDLSNAKCRTLERQGTRIYFYTYDNKFPHELLAQEMQTQKKQIHIVDVSAPMGTLEFGDRQRQRGFEAPAHFPNVRPKPLNPKQIAEAKSLDIPLVEIPFPDPNNTTKTIFHSFFRDFRPFELKDDHKWLLFCSSNWEALLKKEQDQPITRKETITIDNPKLIIPPNKQRIAAVSLKPDPPNVGLKDYRKRELQGIKARLDKMLEDKETGILELKNVSGAAKPALIELLSRYRDQIQFINLDAPENQRTRQTFTPNPQQPLVLINTHSFDKFKDSPLIITLRFETKPLNLKQCLDFFTGPSKPKHRNTIPRFTVVNGQLLALDYKLHKSPLDQKAERTSDFVSNPALATLVRTHDRHPSFARFTEHQREFYEAIVNWFGGLSQRLYEFHQQSAEGLISHSYKFGRDTTLAKGGCHEPMKLIWIAKLVSLAQILALQEKTPNTPLEEYLKAANIDPRNKSRKDRDSFFSEILRPLYDRFLQTETQGQISFILGGKNGLRIDHMEPFFQWIATQIDKSFLPAPIREVVTYLEKPWLTAVGIRELS